MQRHLVGQEFLPDPDLVEPLRERAQQTAELTPAREAKLKSRQRLVAERAALSAELE